MTELRTTTSRSGSTVETPSTTEPRSWRARLARASQPHVALRRSWRLGLGLLSLGVLLLAWAAFSYSGAVEPFFLPSPTAVVSEAYAMYVENRYLHDVLVSTLRVLGGFGAAAAIAVPLGVLIGAFAIPAAFTEHVVGAIRYMPATAFIPLLIVWLGIGEIQKVAVIWIGVFFPLTLMVAAVAAAVPRAQINAAYTLGATTRGVFRKVLVRSAMPGIFDNLRIAMGYAWTYLIVAELIAADRGIGHQILVSQRFLATDAIIVGILTVGLLGIVSDALFRVAYRRLFRYMDRGV